MLPSIKTPRPLPTPIPEADAPFKKGSLWNKGTPRAGTRRKQAFSRQARRSIPDTPNNAKKDTPINVENYKLHVIFYIIWRRDLGIIWRISVMFYMS
jgi:hypothetical protein